MIPVKAQGHPCFDEASHKKVGRMHIPVAPACNIQCRYCYREIGSSDNRPGVAYKILKPSQALEAVEQVIQEDTSIHVIGVAGPGDALANQATFNSLALIHKKFPWLKKCISTNGLRLEERVDELLSVGVSTISVTVNAVSAQIGREFYQKVILDGHVYYENAFDILTDRQLAGIEAASRKGLVVKINTVLVPELNGGHIAEVAKAMKDCGANLMNIMPLKPIGEMSSFRAPTCIEIEEARYNSGKHIEQFRVCKQCRADAVGIPGLGDNAPEHDHGHNHHPLGEEYGPGATLTDVFTGVPLYH